MIKSIDCFQIYLVVIMYNYEITGLCFCFIFCHLHIIETRMYGLALTIHMFMFH
jgi:hypothetical protein